MLPTLSHQHHCSSPNEKILEHLTAIDQLLQDEDFHIRPNTPNDNPRLDEPMVVTQAESDFSIDLVEEQAQEPVSNSVPEPAVFVDTSQSNYNYLQTSSVTGHGQSQPEPRMSAPRPGSKRKHTTETSTIVLRNGLLNRK